MKKFGEGQQPFHAVIDIPEGDNQELTTVTDQALNSLYGELFNLLQTHGINPTTTTNADLKQVARAVWSTVSVGNLYKDTGSSNVKNLTHIKAAGFLFKNTNANDDGFTIEFLNKAENTGAVTVNVFDVENNVNHFNNTPLVNQDGSEIQPKTLTANGLARAYYNKDAGKFVLLSVQNSRVTDNYVYNIDGIALRDTVIQSVDSISALADITKTNGRKIYVASYYAGLKKGGGVFVYDSSKAAINDGGIIINGWVRQDFVIVNPYMFGAYGDWDAYNQVGHDDTVAVQKCFDYIANNVQSVRVGGSPVVEIKAGSYRVSSLYVNKGIRGFGFSMFGYGETSQLWFDPTGNGINVEVEYTQYQDIVFNGSLRADTTATIPYIFKFKHKDKAFDVDATFLNCHARFYNTFARVAGRGFNFKTGSSTYGNTLCEIALDSDLVAATGTVYTLNMQEASRHYVFSNSRVDTVANIFKITGTHAAKEYVNGINCFGNEATGLASFITSTDCRVVFPSIQNNEVISGFNGAYPMGVINVPRAVGVRDIGNRWNNRIGDELASSSSGSNTSMPILYRFSDYIDGFKMIGTSVKNLSSALLYVGSRSEATDKYIKNVTIDDCDFYGFGDTSTNGGFINFADTVDIASKLSNINIINNHIQSNNPKYCYWFNQSMTGLTAFNIRGNKYNALFGSESISFNPQFLVNGAVSPDLTIPQKTATYIVNGDYIECEIFALLSTTLTSGVLTMQLPVPAISANGTISSAHSGTGMFEYYAGFGFAQPIFVKVNGASQQNAEFLQNGASLNLSSKTSSNILMQMRFKYKFK